MYRILLISTLILSLWQCQGQQLPDRSPRTATGPVGGPCEGCEWIFAGLPDQLTARDTSTAWNNAGPRLVIEGTVLEPDGTTPAADVILYYWHTDRSGRYVSDESVPAKARRHGRLRGWLRTGADGHYAIHTIRPASYPSGTEPEHIHLVILEPGIDTPYYIDDFLFTDDPLLTDAERARRPDRGGSGILSLTERDDVWYAERNIVLGQNVPNYPAGH